MTTTQLPPTQDSGATSDPAAPTGTLGQTPGGAPSQSLPATGSQMQMETLNAQMLPAAPTAPTQGGQSTPAGPQVSGGSTSLEGLAQSLAQSYGLPIGRGSLVDESGNFLMTPEQIASASGGAETMGSAAAKMNYISQAVNKQQNAQQQQKGIAALQTGLGLVQSRGRGSAAAMQSGFYQGLADMYSNQQTDAADFTYFIQEEQLQRQEAIARKYEKAQKKKSKWGGLGGLIGGVAGALTGVPGLAQVGAAGGSAIGEWF